MVRKAGATSNNPIGLSGKCCLNLQGDHLIYLRGSFIYLRGSFIYLRDSFIYLRGSFIYLRGRCKRL